MAQSVNNDSSVGAGSLMSMHRYSDQQFPPNSLIHISLRRPNPPILENIHHLPIKPLKSKRQILNSERTYHG